MFSAVGVGGDPQACAGFRPRGDFDESLDPEEGWEDFRKHVNVLFVYICV